MIAASLAHPPDVLVVAAAGALVWLLALPQIRREREKARTAATGPGLVSHELGENMDARTIADREGEALAPFLAGFCRPCAEGVCDRAEHLGLTDADVPVARCPNCLDLSCHGCMDPAETRPR